jgi:tight adherence protein B
VTTRIRFLVVGAAVAALALPMAALGQTPTLREAQDSAFPDKVYIFRTPVPTNLSTSNFSVTENGGPVTALAVDSSAKSSGAIVLIDASDSMRGAPLDGAMAAARAFLAERRQQLPVAVIAYNPEVSVLSEFTTDGAVLSRAVARTPDTAEGTHIYDALIEAAEMAKAKGYARTTAVLLSDGHRRGVQATRAQALAALEDANVRVISVGLRSPQYDAETLRAMSGQTGGTYVESATPAALAPIFTGIGQQLSNEYVVTYRSLMPARTATTVVARGGSLPPATASYTTPAIDLTERGSFDQNKLDQAITSPYLMVFVIVSVLALLVFAVFTAVDFRSRSVRKRMAQYVNVPTEDESKARRAEVAQMLADRAQKKVEGHRWWQSFERDVELAGFKASAVTIAGWTMIAAILMSLVVAIAFQSLLGLFAGLVIPLITRAVIKKRISRKRGAFAEELPDNLEVLAGALRAGHSLIGAMGVMVDGATEPSKTEFRRVLQDEQLGVPLDDALMVMARRMDNIDVEQVAIVTRLNREAGGNTAEVLDRVVENIRGRMELKRLVRVLTAQGRIARYILTAIPVCLLLFFFWVNPEWLSPLWDTNPGRLALGAWVIMLIAGWFAIKKIVEIEV